MNLILEADRIAHAAEEAYSRDRYTDTAWRMIPRELLKAGASPAEAAWVMNSKHMRWAADNANRSHSVSLVDFKRYLRLPGVVGWNGLITQARKALAPVAAPQAATNANDIVGYLEGEDLAEAVAFVIQAATSTTDQALRDKATKLAQRLQARAAEAAKK